MDPARIEEAARILLAARRENYQIDALPADCTPADAVEGRKIADRLLALLDAPTVGWLIGLTNPYMQRNFGVSEPYYAPILAANLHRSPATFAPGALLTRGLECEVAFTIDRDLPARAAPYTDEEVAAVVRTMHGSVEIVNSHFRDWLGLPLPNVIADNGTDGALVLGPPVEDWRAIDRPAIPVTLTVGGALVAQGQGANVMGDPLAVLTWLANALGRAGRGLRADDVVNTGTCAPIHMAEEGVRAVADFGPLGAVEMDFRA